jgi:ABC-type polysaccharide/polyol phosphate export permease
LSTFVAEAPRPEDFVRPRYSIAQIAVELWEARDLVMQFVRRDLTVRYVQAFMGFAWAILMPLLIVCAGLIFRLVVATMANSPLEPASIVSLAAKAIPWAFFSVGLLTATQSVIGNANLIGKVYFPRESLPIASVLAQCTDLTVGVVVLGVLIPILGVSLQWSALWGVVMLFLLIVFTTGCALLSSCANLFYRDVKYILQVVLNFGVFATPVFFEPQMLGRKGAALMLALPLSPFIQGMDVAMIRGHGLLSPLIVTTAKGPIEVWAPWMLLYAAALATAALSAGLVVFRRASGQFAEVV